MPTKSNVDKKFDDPSIIKNTAHVDFNDKNLDNVRFVKVNSMPAVGVHLTTKYYVDNAIVYSVDELPLLRLDPDEKFKLDDQDSIILNSTLTSLKILIELPNKSAVDSLHESSKNRPDLSSVVNDQDNEVGNKKLTNLDFVVVNRNPTSDNEVTNENYVEDSIEEVTVLELIKR